MSIIVESLEVQARPGTSGIAGAVGTVIFTVDSTGIKATSPAKFMQDGFIISSPPIISSELLASSVDKHLFTVTEGRWQVTYATEIHTVVGGAGAQVDVKVSTDTQAPASGTTQLDSVFDLTTTVNTVVNKALIASPTVLGPGDRVSLDFGGTLTGLVGVINIGLGRVG